MLEFAAFLPNTAIGFAPLLADDLAAVAFCATLRFSYPEERFGLWAFLVPPAILLIGLGRELAATPKTIWSAQMWGDSAGACFCCITLLAAPILATILFVMRDSAPARPWLVGAVAGLLAGGITATLYVLHCPEDSLLFVAIWHVLAIMTTSLGGACVAGFYLRW